MESKQISEVGDLQTHFHEVYIYIVISIWAWLSKKLYLFNPVCKCIHRVKEVWF